MPTTCVSRHRARHAPIIVGLLATLSVVLTGMTGQAQEIGRLYASKPPPGYAFVRVVQIFALPPMPPLQLNAEQIKLTDGATFYRAVPGSQPLRLTVAGRKVGGEIVPRPDSYLTVAIERVGEDWQSRVIDEGHGAADGLKAQLRFFNLVPDCAAVLKITDGAVVFSNASFASMLSRSINPVTARLNAVCGDREGSLTLPALRAGDSYSMFLRADDGKIILSGQLDETEAYRER